MTDRIDPGPGWRLLGKHERINPGDEYWFVGGWHQTTSAGCMQGTMAYRRRAAPTATKAIATRATVRGAFPDGAITRHSIECKTGLTPKQMTFASERWELTNKHLHTSCAKYIMLEIQREGEP